MYLLRPDAWLVVISLLSFRSSQSGICLSSKYRGALYFLVGCFLLLCTELLCRVSSFTQICLPTQPLELATSKRKEQKKGEPSGIDLSQPNCCPLSAITLEASILFAQLFPNRVFVWSTPTRAKLRATSVLIAAIYLQRSLLGLIWENAQNR